MNQHEAQRIAAAMHQLRPDWPAKQILTLLAHLNLADRPRRDIAVALTWVACDSQTLTPYRVMESGPWWGATIDTHADHPPKPPRRQEACYVCGRHAHGGCICETGPTTRPPRPAADPGAHVARLRQELR